MKLALPVGAVHGPRSKRVRAIRFVLAMGEVAQCGRMAFSIAAGDEGGGVVEGEEKKSERQSRRVEESEGRECGH